METASFILVVDDQTAVSALVSHVLKEAGYRVLCASDAEKALALCGQLAPEIRVAVLDYHLPGMNGWDLSLQLQQLYPHIGCVMMSGEPPAEYPGFLRKPFRPALLLEAVRRARPQ